MSENGIKCKLLMKYNWFKSDISRKRNCHFWSALLSCKIANCKIKYHAFIESFTDFKTPFNISIKWIGEPNHAIENLKLKTFQPRITGNERKLLGSELLANGITNTRNKIILENEADFGFISRNTLKQIRFEANHVDRISNDININTIASKRLYDFNVRKIKL